MDKVASRLAGFGCFFVPKNQSKTLSICPAHAGRWLGYENKPHQFTCFESIDHRSSGKVGERSSGTGAGREVGVTGS
ncbi:MAG: hypothetical protein AAGB22_07835, partial [Bacteroidota bacterium]